MGHCHCQTEPRVRQNTCYWTYVMEVLAYAQRAYGKADLNPSGRVVVCFTSAMSGFGPDAVAVECHPGFRQKSSNGTGADTGCMRRKCVKSNKLWG